MSYNEKKGIGGLRADRIRSDAGRFDTDIHASDRIDTLRLHDTFGDAVAERAANGKRSFSVGIGEVGPTRIPGGVAHEATGNEGRIAHSAVELAARTMSESDELDGMDRIVVDASMAKRAIGAFRGAAEGSKPRDVSTFEPAQRKDALRADDGAKDVLFFSSDATIKKRAGATDVDNAGDAAAGRAYAAIKKNREKTERHTDVHELRSKESSEGPTRSRAGSVHSDGAQARMSSGGGKNARSVDAVALRELGIDAAMGALSQSDELDSASNAYFRLKGARRGAESLKRAGDRARRAVAKRRGSHAASRSVGRTAKSGASFAAKGSAAGSIAGEGIGAGAVAAGGGSGAGAGAAAAGGGFASIALAVIAGILVVVLLLSVFGTGKNGSTGTLDGNEAIIASFLLDKGLDKTHVAAIMGNFSVESGCNPKLVENNAVTQSMGLTGEYDNYPPELININNVGYGIAQWSYWSRAQALVNYAASTGRPSGDIQTQCEFFWIEFNGSVSEFETVDDLDAATRWFHNVYERSADGEDGMQRRISEASRIYTAMSQAGNGTDAVSRAFEQIGRVVYVWGGCSPGAMDCSGFVSYCLTGQYQRIGTTETFLRWPRAEIPLPGDVCVNSTHCGIYVGDGKMIDCGNSGVGQPRSLDPGMVIVRWPG